MARLTIGVDVVGQKEVAALADSIDRAEKALQLWTSSSSRAGSDKLAGRVKVLNAQFIELASTAQASAAKLDVFFKGPNSSATAKALGYANAIKQMEAAYNSLVTAYAKQQVMSSAGTRKLVAETKAINDNIVAYKKLTVASGSTKLYDSRTSYTKELSTFNASIAAQERGLKELEAQFAKLKSVRSGFAEGSYQAEILKENASIAAQERGLKELEAQIYRVNKARAALKAGSYAVSDYAQSGRDKLAAGATAGGYDYAAQMKAEASAYDAMTGKVKAATTGTKEFATATASAALSSKNLHSVIRGVSGAMGSLWLTYGNIIPMLTGFAAAASTLKTIKLGSEFDGLVRNIEVLNRDLGPAAQGFDQIKESILGIQNTPFTPKELAEGYREFVRAGFTVADAQKNIAETSVFAKDAELELGKAVEFLVGQATVFDDNNISQVANVITKAANDTTTDVKQMTDAFKYAATIGKTMNVSLTETAAAIAVMAQNGQRGSMAGTQLATAMQKLLDPSSKARKYMQELNVQFSAIDVAAGKVKAPFKLFSDLEAATKKLTDAQKTVLFDELGGMRGGRGISVLTAEIQKGGDLWRKELQSFQKELELAGTEASALGRLIAAMSESGDYQLKMLIADVERLFVDSYENASSVQMIKELRDVVSSDQMRSSLQFIVDKILWLTTVAAKGINISVKLIQSTSEGPTSDIMSKLGALGASAGALYATKNYKTAIAAGSAGYLGGAKIGKSIDEALGLTDAGLTNLEKANKELSKYQKNLLNAQTQAQKYEVGTDSKTYWNNEIDSAVKAIKLKKQEIDTLKKSGEVTKVEATSTAVSTVAKTELIKVTERLMNRNEQINAQIERSKMSNYQKTYEETVTPKLQEFIQLKEQEIALLNKGLPEDKQTKFYAGSSAYDAAVNAEKKRLEQAFSQELSKAQKQDERLNNSGKKASGAVRQVRAEYKLLANDIRDVSKANKDWLKEYDKYSSKLYNLQIETQTAGMNDYEKELYNLNKAFDKNYESIDWFSSALKDNQKQITETVAKLKQVQTEAAAVDSKASGLVGRSSAEQDSLGITLDNKVKDLIKQLEDLRKARTDLEGMAKDFPTKTREEYKDTLNAARRMEALSDAYSRYGLVSKEVAKLKLAEVESHKKLNEELKLEQHLIDLINNEELARVDFTNAAVSIGKLLELGASESYTALQSEAVDFYKDVLPDAVNSSADALAKFARDVAQGNSSISDAWEALGETISNVVFDIMEELTALYIKMALFGDMTSSVGGVSSSSGGIVGMLASSVGSFLSVGAQHSGGVIGVDPPTFTRIVPAAAFRNAPKYHSGFLSGEYPAILKKGESVLTEGQMSAMVNSIGGASNINVTVNNAPADTDAKVTQSSDGYNIDVIVDLVSSKMQERVDHGYSTVNKRGPWL